ncbi:hypothetical protein I8748_20170 [Nostoc sp. CENA67]|uniref:Uncharacterized protein n=1 Tax=Amazonocrinis nigriterrae CENA67 TaxID=2794033 RepID=A0A8J7HVY8_9NOST|nr:hypothetical protein [Amazonocrinis nigriterrae]MBH8564470.1 hypothetical protein [Amazonocrinis nigriterrae CENA67]
MKKLLLLTLFIAAIPSVALAQSAYVGADGYFSIRGLQPSKSYSVDLGGNPLISAGNSNSCGILRVAATGAVKVSDRIEIKDEAAGKVYGFENSSSIPVKDIKCIPGQVKTEREIWKDSKGTIWISGLTTSSAQTIRLLTKSPTRTIRANQCGMVSFRLNNPEPKAIILNNQAFPIAGATRGGGIACKRGTLYTSYPPQPEISPVSADEWKKQNSVGFDEKALIIDESTRWIGYSGNGEGSQQTPTPPAPPSTPTKPMPPYGKACRLNGGNNILVVGLKPNTMYEFSDQEHRKSKYTNFREQTTDSEGKTVLENIDLTKLSSTDGESVWLVAYENGEDDYNNIISYGIIKIPNCI